MSSPANKQERKPEPKELFTDTQDGPPIDEPADEQAPIVNRPDIEEEWETLLKKLEEDFGGMDSDDKIGEGEYFLEILDRFEGNVEQQEDDIIDEITDENITKITEELGDILEKMFPENNTAIWDYDENFDYFLQIIDTDDEDDEEVIKEINISKGIRDISYLYQKITDIINEETAPSPHTGKKKKTKKRRRKKTKKKSIKRKTIKKKSKKKKSKKKKTKKKDLVDQIIQRLGY